MNNKLENLSEEAKQRFEKAFIWLEENKDNDFVVGRTEVADGVFALRQKYKTFDNNRFEGHRSYADIQYVVDGSETIDISDISNIGLVTEEYTDDKDILFCNVSEFETCLLKPNDFEIFLPSWIIVKQFPDHYRRPS